MKTRFSYLLTIGMGLVIIAGAATYAIANRKPASDSHSLVPIAACKTLTLSEAQAVLDASARLKTNSSATTKNNIQTTTCAYATATQTATVTVQSPLDVQGLTWIDNTFHDRMGNYLRVTGYGHHAYYDEATGQLNVHDNGSWYVISLSHDATLANLELVADKVFN
jgi:hypothetical protein